MNSVVLDASALLAVLHRETGFQLVIPHLRGGLVSAVNYCEVLKKMVERGSALASTHRHLTTFNLTIVPFDQSHAIRSAEIWTSCKPHGLSAADRACVSLGMIYEATVMTADQRMKDVELDVNIELIRNRTTKSVRK